MNILIPFSGGLDSTFLIYKTLKDENTPILTYFKVKNNTLKTRIELIHRKAIIGELKKIFEKSILERWIEDLGEQIEIEITGEVNESYALIQPPIWIYGIHSVSERKYDKIQIAYVLGDHAVSYLEDIQTLYKAYTPFVRNKINDLKPLEFPLIKYHKEEIIDELPKSLLNLTWTCENPRIVFEDEQCFVYSSCIAKRCKCTPCQHNPIASVKYGVYIKTSKELVVLDNWEFVDYVKKNDYLRNKTALQYEINTIIDSMEIKPIELKKEQICEQLSLNLDDKEDCKEDCKEVNKLPCDYEIE